jgi:hypothetical protein
MNFFTPKLMKIRWSSLFFGSFAPHYQIKRSIHASNFISTSLPNQVEHTCLKFHLQICKYEWVRILFVDGGLDSKLQHYGPCKNSSKNSKTSHSDHSGHIEGVIMQNHEQKEKVKKSEKPRFYRQNKIFFENPALQPLGSFSHMAACRSSLENTWKMSLILVFNKNLPQTHTESELGVLDIHGKLVKYVVHLSKRKNWKKIIFLHTSWPNSNRPVFSLKEF